MIKNQNYQCRYVSQIQQEDVPIFCYVFDFFLFTHKFCRFCWLHFGELFEYGGSDWTQHSLHSQVSPLASCRSAKVLIESVACDSGYNHHTMPLLPRNKLHKWNERVMQMYMFRKM